MRIKYCNFDTWSNNHSFEHKDRMYRELYPYTVFEKIDFNDSLINKEQEIYFNYSKYFVEIQKIEILDNGRYKTTFKLNTVPQSEQQEWKDRSWDELFQIVYTPDFDFITVFTKNEDSSKDYIKRFYKGNFIKISQNRSLPISDLLFRTLISTLCEDLFGKGNLYEEFDLIRNGHRDLPQHNQFKIKSYNTFAPIFSQDRKLWVCHAFNEEKAHRIGLFNGNQCDKLFVVYCNPTYTRHHRCNYPDVHIVSLFEFAYRNSRKIVSQFDKQIRFLQNHLNEQDDLSVNDLEKEIENPLSDEYKIYRSELMEALGIMKIIPTNQKDLFHYLTSMNLLNAWINRRNKKNGGDKKLFGDMFSFKSYFSETLVHLVSENSYSSKIYLEPSLVIIELEDFQFSFHHIPYDETLKAYTFYS